MSDPESPCDTTMDIEMRRHISQERLTTTATSDALPLSETEITLEEPDAIADHVAWNRAVGWCWPSKRIHLLRKPDAPAIPWWKVIGPETRTQLLWRKDLRVCSVYSWSCLSFSAVGIVAMAFHAIGWINGVLLILTGFTSFQSDVTFLGIDHGWRTVDTVLALGQVGYYVIRAIIAHSPFSLLAFVPLAWAVGAFVKSQAAETFKDRSYWHINWHFGVQLALLMLIFRESLQREFERAFS